MNIKALSTKFNVRALSKDDINIVFTLCKGNPLYYHFYPPAVTMDSVKSDMLALPPNKTLDDKYFIGFFRMNANLQGSGIGTSIISECLQYLKSIRFQYARLGYVKENYQAKSFWQKNHFKPTGKESQQEHYTIVVMEREL